MQHLDRLENAYKNREADDVECALYEEITIDDGCTEILVQLLECDWHHSHEDIALTLQKLKDPKAIKALQQSAETKFDYLAYDNSEAFARKCIWALADIGTEEAKQALNEISASSNNVVAGYAQKRLDSWEWELLRKP